MKMLFFLKISILFLSVFSIYMKLYNNSRTTVIVLLLVSFVVLAGEDIIPYEYRVLLTAIFCYYLFLRAVIKDKHIKGMY